MMAKRGIDIICHMLPRPPNVIDLSLVPRGGIVLDLGPEFVEIDPFSILDELSMSDWRNPFGPFRGWWDFRRI